MISFLNAAAVIAATLSIAVSAETSSQPIVFQPTTPQTSNGTAAVAPRQNVTLGYQAMNATSLEVQVNAEMAKNSVILEHLSLSQVVCSASSVNVTFESAEEYAQAIATWPSSGFILFTNHIGQCDTETERGVYEVSALTFNKDSLTIVASTTKSTLQDHATNVHIAFGSSGALAKRDLTSTVDFSWSGDIVDIKNLVIAADTSVNATLDLSGNITYDVSKTKFSALSIDLDLALSADLDVNASVTGSYSTDLYKYSPASLSISAFSIPGILDVGPILSLSLGVELEVSATADINADLSAQITAGKVHLDFLDGNKTTTSGWTPKYTASADVSAEVTAELNPFVDGTVEIGVSVFDGLVNLSAGIDADATVVNAFSVDGKFDVNSTTGITFPTASGTCVNGLWFDSTFVFEIDAFVTEFYSVDLYKVEVPIYKSQCVAF